MTAFRDFSKLLREHPEHRFVLLRDDGEPDAVLLSWKEYRKLLGQRENFHIEGDLTGEGHSDTVASIRSREEKQEIKKSPKHHPSRGGALMRESYERPIPPMDEWDRMMEQVSAMSESSSAPQEQQEQEEEQYLFESVE